MSGKFSHKVLVRFTKQNLSMHQGVDRINQYLPWLMEHTVGEIEYGYVNGARVGFYLEPEDAIAFKLRFNL